jgi:quinol-cytochrome oxidoreductase complex cytochrome b subunit
MQNRLNSLKLFIINSRVWKSFFRHGWPDNPLDKALVMTTNVYFHLHPVKVSRKSIKWNYSFGLGLLSAIVFLELTVTGILLMFYYAPTVERAYSYITSLQTTIPFGQLLRNLHRWGAHLMVIVVVLHMARVFYTGAYKPPRQFNWVVGVILLLLTLGASFTGYLLPWDQLAFWAITVGTSVASYAPVVGETARGFLLGGPEVGQEALTRFYALHIMIIPAAIFLIISLHIWRVRKDGGMAANDLPDEEASNGKG